MGNAILCGDCKKDAAAIRVAGDLVVMIEENRLVVRRGGGRVRPSSARQMLGRWSSLAGVYEEAERAVALLPADPDAAGPVQLVPAAASTESSN